MNSYRRGLRSGVLVNPKLFILETVNFAPPTIGWSSWSNLVKNLYYLVRVITIQDLIDQGLVDLGRPEVTTDPLPTHDTRAVPLPPGGIHSIEFLGDEILMMGWDGEAPQPICLYADLGFSGYTHGQQIMFRPIRGKWFVHLEKGSSPGSFKRRPSHEGPQGIDQRP